MECGKIRQSLSSYLDGMLEGDEHAQIEAHLESCPTCRSEYQSLQELSVLMQDLGTEVLKAPAGLYPSVMKSLEKERKESYAYRLRSFWRSSRNRLAAGIAAAGLLAAGWAGTSLFPLLHVADRPGGSQASRQPSAVVETETVPGKNGSQGTAKPSSSASAPGKNGTSSHPAGNGGTKAKTPAHSAKTPATADSLPLAAQDKVSTLAGNPVNPVLFSNKDRSIRTVALKIQVGNLQSAMTNASGYASGLNGKTEKMGIQPSSSGSTAVLNLTLNRQNTDTLIRELSGLGTVVSKEVDSKDINSQFAQSLSRYQSLLSQRNAASSAGEKEQLDRQIRDLESTLTSWDQQASQDTVVLWLMGGQ